MDLLENWGGNGFDFDGRQIRPNGTLISGVKEVDIIG